jgi:hypothetical protein
MSAQSPWGLKYTGSTVFDQSTSTGIEPVTGTSSHNLGHSRIDGEEEEDRSRGKHYSRRCSCGHYHHESDGPLLRFTHSTGHPT